MSNKVIINGNEYSYGEVVETEFFDDTSKEIVLNGDVVKVGDVWLTRGLKEVLITNISISRWPIRDNKECTYSVAGITNFDFKVSEQDLMSKVKDTEDVKDTEHMKNIEDIEDAEEPEDTEEFGVKPTNDVKYLPILDIQIGDVWETKEGKKVEIAHHNTTQVFEWTSTEGVSYTNKGTYFSSMHSPNKDLVTRVLRVTEINEATETNDAPVLDMPSNYADALRHFNFENAVKMHMDSIVSLIGDRICEKVKSRDISTVKYLTKVLEKVIALENL